MQFNSLQFLTFAIAFFVMWPFVSRWKQARWIFLTAASLYFYKQTDLLVTWEWKYGSFVYLILFSGFVDYFAGLAMQRDPARKRLYLTLSLIGNLGSLAFFKYAIWFSGVVDARMAAWFGVESNLQAGLPGIAWFVPVGISFYTFQSMSYTIDIYRGKLQPTRNVFHFFAYLSLFPQLVAGPIIRARDLLQKLEVWRRPSHTRLWHGLKLIVIGLFQKMVLADNLAIIVNHGFKDPTHNPSTLYWWAVMLSFAFQIYFDFSGYSQIARGLAKWMGLHFKMNFNHPYLACSLREFWTRWHISLSQWFRDYVYIPLGGARKGWGRAIVNMWIVMVVSGLWHGANFTFVMWGVVHALFLTIERVCWRFWGKVPHFLRHGSVLMTVLVAWVFFRAESISQAWIVLENMFTWSPRQLKITEFFDSYFFLALALAFEGMYALSLKVRPLKRLLRNPWVEAVELGLLIAALVFFRGPEQQFIYFQF